MDGGDLERTDFDVIATFGGHPLQPALIDAVAASKLAGAARLAELRAVTLSLVDAIEPDHALARLQHTAAQP